MQYWRGQRFKHSTTDGRVSGVCFETGGISREWRSRTRRLQAVDAEEIATMQYVVVVCSPLRSTVVMCSCLGHVCLFCGHLLQEAAVAFDKRIVVQDS